MTPKLQKHFLAECVMMFVRLTPERASLFPAATCLPPQLTKQSFFKAATAIADGGLWQKWATDSSSFIEDEYRQIGTEPLTIVSPKMIRCELPNDAIRTSYRYTPQYVNSLLEHIFGWKRSEQEKVPGMHRDYCGADGRAKRPWLRVDVLGPKIISPTLDFGEPEDTPF